MVQGTCSGAGKSLLVAILCKFFRDSGLKVAPFKAQNMSLNSYVSADGGEIARAQAFQAFAAGIEPLSIMNPILLKPKGDATSQVMVLGKPYADLDARSYWDFARNIGWRIVARSLKRLLGMYDLVIIEGAGSPAEINLYDRDITNMRIAEYAKAPVILVADIDRGGVFASIYGTIKLLKPRHRRLVKGIVINKFRGDIELLKPGIEMLEKNLGVPTLGVIPYIESLKLPLEDSLSINELTALRPGRIDVAIIRLPRISNFTDFEPLKLDPIFSLRLVQDRHDLGKPDVIIIPGTKNTISDLEWLNESGLADAIVNLKGKAVIIGICGGYQMLGSKVIDEGIEETKPTTVEGLGLLDVITIFRSYRKETVRVEAEILGYNKLLKHVKTRTFRGYMIHMGKTIRLGDKPAFKVIKPLRKLEGAVKRDEPVVGTYIHGLFDEIPLREALARIKGYTPIVKSDMWSVWLQELNRIIDIASREIDFDYIRRIVFA
ncbi:MAG: cobyric acid synthase [Candidatus Nezhaarchaeales archaeon]